MEYRLPNPLLQEARQQASSSWIDVREFLRTRREILRDPRSTLLPSATLGMSPFRFAATINLVLPAALGAALVMVLTLLAPPPSSLDSLRAAAYAQLRSEVSGLLPADRGTLRRMRRAEVENLLGVDLLWSDLGNEAAILEFQRHVSRRLAGLTPKLEDPATMSAVATLERYLAYDERRSRFDARMNESGIWRVLDSLLVGLLLLLNATVFRRLMLRTPGLWANGHQADRVLLYLTTAILAPLCLIWMLFFIFLEGLSVYHVPYWTPLMVGAGCLLGGASVFAYLGCAGSLSALLADKDVIEPALRARTRRNMVASMLVTIMLFFVLIIGLVFSFDRMARWMFPG